MTTTGWRRLKYYMYHEPSWGTCNAINMLTPGRSCGRRMSKITPANRGNGGRYCCEQIILKINNDMCVICCSNDIVCAVNFCDVFNLKLSLCDQINAGANWNVRVLVRTVLGDPEGLPGIVVDICVTNERERSASSVAVPGELDGLSEGGNDTSRGLPGCRPCCNTGGGLEVGVGPDWGLDRRLTKERVQGSRPEGSTTSRGRGFSICLLQHGSAFGVRGKMTAGYVVPYSDKPP